MSKKVSVAANNEFRHYIQQRLIFSVFLHFQSVYFLWSPPSFLWTAEFLFILKQKVVFREIPCLFAAFFT